MEDYPRTLEEFEGRFATEQACREYLMQLRWPQGFVCPRCGGRRARPSRRGLLRCGQCDYQASVTAGTIFQDTRLPLRTWFRTMWWVTSQKNGASALGLQSILGLGSYRTAWALLHKLRRAMVRPGRERLSGRVEVDETYVGGAEEGLRGRQTQKKALLAIAAEEDGAGIGRIRMKRIRGASKQQLHGFIQEAVEPDSTIHTDGWEGYVGLEALGYRHEYDFLAGSSQSASELLPHVHRVAALLKRWLIGTHQGAVSREHLDYYLDEYTFRFNRRRSRHRGKLFYRLVQQAAIEGDPLPPGQVWAITPGSTDTGTGLCRIEVTAGPGSGVRILNQPTPPPFRESVKIGEQNLYARAKELVGNRDPRSHEFILQLRAMDSDKTGEDLVYRSC